MKNKFVVVAITQDEAQIWNSGVAPGTKPEKIEAVHTAQHKLRHVRRHQGHLIDQESADFFSEIAHAVEDAGEILLLGHGKGKASAMFNLGRYWERKFPALSQKIVGTIDSDLIALSEAETLEIARNWFDNYR